MNLKRYLLAAVTCALCVSAFAYPTPDEDPTAKLLEQYAAQAQALQKSFEQHLLPPLKATAQLALKIQSAGQTEMTQEQEALLTQYAQQLDKALDQLVAPALKEVDLAQFNEQYKQIAKTYGAPEQEFTLQSLTDMFKGVYLMGALAHFEQTQKLSEEELTVLTEIFLSADEEE